MTTDICYCCFDKFLFLEIIARVYSHLAYMTFWNVTYNMSNLIAMTHDCALVCQKQLSRAGLGNYIPQILWDVITCPYPWYLLLSYESSIARQQITADSGEITALSAGTFSICLTVYSVNCMPTSKWNRNGMNAMTYNDHILSHIYPWWRHDMGTLSAVPVGHR